MTKPRLRGTRGRVRGTGRCAWRGRTSSCAVGVEARLDGAEIGQGTSSEQKVSSSRLEQPGGKEEAVFEGKARGDVGVYLRVITRGIKAAINTNLIAAIKAATARETWSRVED